MWEAGEWLTYLPAQAACATCCPEGDLGLLVLQGPGHPRSETFGSSLVPSLGPVSSLHAAPSQLPKASFSSVYGASHQAVDTHSVLGESEMARVCGLCKYELT